MKLRYQVMAFGSGNIWRFWEEPTRESARDAKKYLKNTTEDKRVYHVYWIATYYSIVPVWSKVLIWDRVKKEFVT